MVRDHRSGADPHSDELDGPMKIAQSLMFNLAIVVILAFVLGAS